MYSIIRTNFLLCYINFNLRRLQSSLHVYNKFYEIKIYRIFPEILKNRLHNIFLEYFILLSNFREKNPSSARSKEISQWYSDSTSHYFKQIPSLILLLVLQSRLNKIRVLYRANAVYSDKETRFLESLADSGNDLSCCYN